MVCLLFSPGRYIGWRPYVPFPLDGLRQYLLFLVPTSPGYPGVLPGTEVYLPPPLVYFITTTPVHGGAAEYTFSGLGLAERWCGFLFVVMGVRGLRNYPYFPDSVAVQFCFVLVQ